MPKSLLELDGLTKEFGSEVAVDDISANIESDLFLCILGPDGAGKTTLFRLITGLEEENSGKVRFHGEDYTGVSPDERPVSMISQNFALYPHMNVFRNIEYPLKISKIPKSRRKEEISQVTEFLGIDDLLERSPDELSGGEQQRVAIAKGLVEENEMYLLDEPLVNLDYKIRENMTAELKRMQKELGQTIIYAASDPEEALSMAEDVWIMRDGTFVEKGPIRKTYRNPQNLFTAKYLGYPEINTFDASVESIAGEEIEVDAGFFRLQPGSGLAGELDVGDELILALRPENIDIDGDQDERTISLDSELIISEIVGAESIVHVSIKDREVDEETRIYHPEVLRTDPGKILQITFDPDDILIYREDNHSLISTGDDRG